MESVKTSSESLGKVSKRQQSKTTHTLPTNGPFDISGEGLKDLPQHVSSGGFLENSELINGEQKEDMSELEKSTTGASDDLSDFGSRNAADSATFDKPPNFKEASQRFTEDFNNIRKNFLRRLRSRYDFVVPGPQQRVPKSDVDDFFQNIGAIFDEDDASESTVLSSPFSDQNDLSQGKIQAQVSPDDLSEDDPILRCLESIKAQVTAKQAQYRRSYRNHLFKLQNLQQQIQRVMNIV